MSNFFSLCHPSLSPLAFLLFSLNSLHRYAQDISTISDGVHQDVHQYPQQLIFSLKKLLITYLDKNVVPYIIRIIFISDVCICVMSLVFIAQHTAPQHVMLLAYSLYSLSFSLVLLNLFDVMDHFSPRLCFGAHFMKNLFQNNHLFQEESCYKTKEC